MKTRHILFFTKFWRFGGTERSILLLARELIREGYRCTVLIHREGSFAEKLRNEGIPCVSQVCRWYNPWVYGRISKWLKNNQIDCLFLHHARIFALVAHQLGIKTIQRVNLPQKGRIFRWGSLWGVDRFFDRFIDGYVAVSNDIAGSLRALKIPSQKIQVIVNGIDMGEIDKTQALSKTELGFSPDCFLVGAVGRLEYQKGFDQLIRSYAKFQDHHTEARLIIVGSGSEAVSLKALVNQLALQDCVKFVPYVDNPFSYMKAFDLYVLSSRWEGLANVVLEALACQCPVAAADCEGIRQVILQKKTGIIFPKNDIDQMARIMEECMAESKRWQQYACEGRKLIQNHFTIDKMIYQTQNFIKSLSEASRYD